MALASSASVLKKASASTFLVNVDVPTANILRDCFRQFNIEVSTLGTKDVDRLNREKVDACVLLLDDRAEEILETARNSKSNRRIVIFGICENASDTARFSKYGVNVLLEKPVDRQNALRAVRSTHLLIINEFRRYVRIPIVVNIDGVAGVENIGGSTEEVSGGGMSIRYKGKLEHGDEVQLAVHLPKQPVIKIRGTVCWIRHADSLAGVRFEADSPAREAVKRWIDQYLEIG